MDERQYKNLLSATLANSERLKRIEEKLDSERAKERLSPKEVCEMLDISKSTYRRYHKAGILTQHKTGGKAYVLRSEIEILQSEGKI